MFARTIQLLLGPELYWLAIYAAALVIASRPERGYPAGVVLLERMVWAVPLIAIPLSFAVFYWLTPMVTARGWITARLMMATFIGLNACLIAIIDRIDYGDSRNSGVLGFWVIGVLVGGLLWILGYLVVLITGARGRIG